ncbi:hypothetical protein FBU59_002036 [Linderina macrospora]|uniref:Uncharacterized protein n=1 Tax=Linderina macrospora TaxID=4868 RepID=A0ACC1JCD3_9FUNG|nr:hypothetical protein FBU59_002036 [Linderina macrospora]
MAPLWVAMVLATLDLTAVSTIMPTIGSEFDALKSVNWIATTYMLAFTAILPALGKLSDVFGRRDTILGFALVFVAGSVMCGAAKGMGLMLAGRVVAGVGGSGMFMFPIIVASDLGTERQRVINLGVLGIAAAVSSVLGPVIAGVMADNSAWRWLFYMNAPILGVVLPVIYIFMDLPRPNVPVWKITTLLLALNYGGDLYAWSSAVVIVLFVLSGVLFIAFIVIETKIAVEPILPPRLFKSRNVLLITILQPFAGIALFPPLFYIVYWYSIVLGASPKSSGLHLIPAALTISVLIFLSGFIIQVTGRYRSLIVISTVLCSLSTAMLLFLKEDISNARQIGLLIVFGIGNGLNQQSHVIGIQAAVSADDMAAVTSCLYFFRYLGGAIGIAVLNTIYRVTLTPKINTIIKDHPLYYNVILGALQDQKLIRNPAVSEIVRNEFVHANQEALHIMFIAGFAITCAAIPVSFFVRHIPLATTAKLTVGH